MKECWLPVYYLGELIPYEVSNMGKVRSVKRSYRFENKGGKVMRQQLTGNSGYLSTQLTISFKKQRAFAIHQLVAMAFVENPEKKKCVNHKDGDKKNNNASNLEWVTYSENNLHAYKTGLKRPTKSINKGKYGINHPASKKVRCIENGLIYESMCDAANFVGSGHKAISQAVRTGYSVYGFHFELVQKRQNRYIPTARPC